MRNAFVNTVLNNAKKRKDMFIISGDAGLGVFDELKEGCADNFLNLGIAEQNMISFSAGLSLAGFKVYAYNIIPFLLYRCYEQIRNDICYQRLAVTLTGIGSGITYPLQGMTHYSIEDLGIAQTLPNLAVISPADLIESKLAAEFSLNCETPLYVRLAKKGEPNIHKDSKFDISQPQLINDGEDVAIVFHGSIGIEVIKARDILIKKGIKPKLISNPMIMPLDFDKLFFLCRDVKNLVVVEEHYLTCGLGSIIAQEYLKRNPKWKLHNLGIRNKFIHEIKDLNGMRDYFGISAEEISIYIEKITK